MSTQSSDKFVSRVLDLVARAERPPGTDLSGGTTPDTIGDFEKRTGIEVPDAVEEWLCAHNGEFVGPGNVYGIRPVSDPLSIERVLGFYSAWAPRGWLPIAGDGSGNTYVCCTGRDVGKTGAVCFIDAHQSTDLPAYAVGSDVWHFLHGLLRREAGERGWPFDSGVALDWDPGLAGVDNRWLPWNVA